MKKILILPILTLSLTGCGNSEKSPEYDNTWAMYGKDVYTKVVKIEGHKYILMKGFYSGTIIHAESCNCKK